MPTHLATSPRVERGEFEIALAPEAIVENVTHDYEIVELYKGENWSLTDALLGLGVIKWLRKLFPDPQIFYLAHKDDLEELKTSPF